MATSGNLSGYWSSTYTTARWYFSWTATKEETPGQTKVSWELYTKGRSTDPKWLATSCEVTLAAVSGYGTLTGGTLYKLAEDSKTNENDSFNNIKRKSGTFIVTHNGSGAGRFTITMKGRIYNDKDVIKTSSQTFYLDTNYPYTDCSAPTSLTCDKSIAKPEGKVYLTWSGAEAGRGSSHTISSYTVQYKIGAGSWITYSNSATLNSNGKYEFTVPKTATRGSTLQFQVKANSSIDDDYDSSYKATKASDCKINILPTKPTVTVSGGTLIAHGGSATIIASVGGTGGDSGQSATLQYKKSTSTTWTKYTEALTVSSSVTYEFRTWDGLEGSEIVSKTFTANTSAPSISSVTLEGTALDAGSAQISDVSYVISPTIKLGSPSGGYEDGTNTYKYRLYTCTETGTGRTFVATLGTTTNTQLTVTDIRSHKAPLTSGEYYYTVGVIRNDGIEDSDVVFPNPIKVFYIPKLPSVTFESDYSGNSTFAYFSKQIKVVCTPMAGYDKTELAIYKPDGSLLTTMTQNGLSPSFSLTSLTRGSKYTFKARPKSSSFTPNSYLNSSAKTRIYSVTIDNLSTSPTSVNPYTSDGPTLSFRNFLNATAPSDTERWLHGVGTSSDLTIEASYGTKQDQITIENYSWTSPPNATQSTLKVELSKTQLQNLFDGLGIDKNKTSSTSVTLKLSFTNQYAETISGSTTINVCYVTAGTAPVINDFSYTILAPDGKSAATILTENCKIKINGITMTTLYHSISQIQLQVGTSSAHGEILDTTVNKTVTVGTTSFDLAAQSIPEISKNQSSIQAQIRVKNSAGQWSAWKTQNLTLEAKSLVQPRGTITEASWNNENQVTVTFRITSLGFSQGNCDTFSARLYWVSPTGDVAIGTSDLTGYFFKGDESANAGQTKTITFTAPSGWGSDNVQIKVKMTSSLYSTGDITDGDNRVYKQVDTSPLRVYKATSTMSLRKNRVGINCDLGSSDFMYGALVISAHNDQRYVYFTDSLGDGKKFARIELIDDAEKELRVGKIQGFIIDGGSW